MIKFNETYSINNGQESIVFTEGKGNSISGKYDSGTLTGNLDGNLLYATYNNQKNNSAGLIEFEFNENGFNAKWKQGLEPGPMRGKWEGILNNGSTKISDSNDSESDNSILSNDQQNWINEKYPYEYIDTPIDWLDSKAFMLKVVKIFGTLISFASERLKADKDIVIAAIENGGMENITNESFLIELSQKSSIEGKIVDFKVRDLVKAVETLFLNIKIGELDGNHKDWKKHVKEMGEQWFEFNQMIYKNHEMDGETLHALAQAGFNKFGPCPTDGKTINEYNRNFLIEAINKQDDALEDIISHSLCQLENFNYSDLIPKATELLWNKTEKSYWNALNILSLYDEDEGINELKEELSRDFVIKVIQETREFDEGTDEERDEFENFVSDNGLD